MTPATTAVLAQAADLGPLERTFVRLVDGGPLSAPIVAVAVAIALGVGAAHALAPGHGKAITAAYLVGTRGRARDALVLGTTVALMHTASVLVVGLGLHLALRGEAAGGGLPAAAQQVAPVLGLASGLLVAGVGAGLLTRQLRLRRAPAQPPAGDHAEAGDTADRAGDTAADEEHAARHGLSPRPPLSRRGLVLLGVSGGLLPSPPAFLVLATAAFTGRTAFGLLLVAAFSVGLAVTSTVVGLAVVAGRDLALSRLGAGARRLMAGVPLVAAAAVLVGGVAITVGAALRL